jgi:hypothetical protein
MSDSILPVPSVELLVRMSYNIDFKDKVLKILGSGAKVAAATGSPNEKDLRGFASQLSAARRWMKFVKIIRSTPEIIDPFADVRNLNIKKSTSSEMIRVGLSKIEFFADIFQMLAEDVHTLHKAKFWNSGLGLKPIQSIDVIEDRAWWFWSVIASINSYMEFRQVSGQLRSSQLRLEALNPETVPNAILSMKQEVAILKIKYYLVLFKLIKFACEVVDSSIALTPERIKALNPALFEIVSCIVGSTSAISSLHKILFNESRAISASGGKR